MAAAALWLTQLSAQTSYIGGVLGPLVLVGIAGGLLFLPLNVLVLSGVADEDSGAASGALQTAQQVGGALGVAVLASVFGAVAAGDSDPVAFSQGVARAFVASSAFAIVALAIVACFIRPAAPVR